MIYKINKGNHISSLFTKDRLLPFTGLKAEGIFMLHDNCWHERNTIEYTGWNKLAGISQLFGIHTNSGRLVWQPDFSKKGRFRMANYVYSDGGKWVEREMIGVEANIKYDWCVEWKQLPNEKNGYWMFYIDDYVSTQNGTKPKCGVKCYPYFGGRSTAPHNMKIELNYR